MSYELLQTIDEPASLRKLDRKQLGELATELRAFVLESVSKTGGHLSSNLGSVELTIALHYVFNTPEDRIVWDVGHQTYPHKILTGRREAMARLRMLGGISGFPRRSESAYDTFGTAHSSTSISAALGMAVAAKRKGEKRHVIAVIGDGAMSAGMAFEAMNNAGIADANLLVILNDNDMSISPAVGGMNRYLARLVSGRFYAAARRAAEKVLSGVPPLWELARKVEEHAKGMVVPSTLFEEFGFNYIGPIDGHDLDSLIPTLKNIKALPGPQFLHIVTTKGQGYKLAEADPVLYHGVSKFEPAAGIAGGKPGGKPTFTQVFGDWLCDMAERDPRLVGITPAMREGSGLVKFAEQFPDRYFDVGIAEQHAVTFAAGLACEGLKPVVAIYSTFLQRAYDQLIHDVADPEPAGAVRARPRRAGRRRRPDPPRRVRPRVPALRPEHHRDGARGRERVPPDALHRVPARYPGGGALSARRGLGVAGREGDAARSRSARARFAARAGAIAILAFGTMLKPALEAGEELDATVVNMRFVKPLDDELVAQLARTHALLVTVEDNVVMGGAGQRGGRGLAAQGMSAAMLHLGLPDRFIDHGDQNQLLAARRAGHGRDPRVDPRAPRAGCAAGESRITPRGERTLERRREGAC